MALEIRTATGKAADEKGAASTASDLLSSDARMERVARLAPAQGNVAASNVPGARAEPNYDPFRLTGLVADRNLYLGKDEMTVHDSPPAGGATLLAAKGGNIPPETVAKHGLELSGDKVVQKKKADGSPASPVVGRINEGQIDDGTPLVKAPTTGVIVPTLAPENPMTAIEEELKGKNPEPGSAEAKAAAAKKEAASAPAKKTTVVKTARKSARKGR